MVSIKKINVINWNPFNENCRIVLNTDYSSLLIYLFFSSD